MRDWGQATLAIMLTAILCVMRSRQLAQTTDQLSTSLASLKTQTARLTPSQQQLTQLATHLTEQKAKMAWIRGMSPRRQRHLLATLNQRLPPDVYLSQVVVDVDKSDIHLSGYAAGTHPLDRIADCQQAVSKTPFANVQLAGTSTIGSITTFQMTLQIQNLP